MINYRVQLPGVSRYLYHNTLEKMKAGAPANGALLYQRRAPGPWVVIGVVYPDQFFDSPKYVDAFELQKYWDVTHDFPSQFAFETMVVTGSVKCRRRFYEGYRRMQNLFALHAVRFADDSTEDEYSYVVTDYGRELAVLVKQLRAVAASVA